jgi:hypothetical protein
MRSLLAGLLILILSSSVFAQATGEVESVGFNNSYRPDCWTPMVVRLKPTTNDAGTYSLQVRQYDLDGDRAIYSKQITLNGADVAPEQRFWMYFLPQPIDRGLPEPPVGTLKDLQSQLKVFLCTANGTQITQIPITAPLHNIDPFRDYSQQPRGAKLILAVSDGGSQPVWRDYQTAIGLMEDVEVVTLQPRDLPEDPLGYEAVDSIVWLDSDPAQLDSGGQHKLAALQDYVRYGGQLVISQPTTDWQKTASFGDLLPVVVSDIGTKNDLEPLRSMARPKERDPVVQSVDVWNQPKGPFQFARATAKPNTVVEQWIDWKGDGSYSDTTPYLVRSAYGLGQVAWVAQDLGNPVIVSRATTGWPYVWDQVFGWNNDTYVQPFNASKDDPDFRARMDLYAPGEARDLGTALIGRLNFQSTGVWLIFVAIAFFIVYWIVAGLGGYFFLLSRKRLEFSWFFFSLSALAATAVTGLVVKVVVRGPPQIRHLSLVRVAPNQPSLVYSRLGLYIKRDGPQTIELDGASHEGVSYVSNLAEHPQFLERATLFPAPDDYQVPVRDLDSTDAPAIDVPYRSSMKKFQARWVGDFHGKFTGSVQLDLNQRTLLAGSITNQTGLDFTDVYLAFRGKDSNRVIYLPRWLKSTTIDFAKDLGRPVLVGNENNVNLAAWPGDGKVISDSIGSAAVKAGNSRDLHWMGFWYSRIRGGAMSTGQEVDDSNLPSVFPMLSLFDLLPPLWNQPPDVVRQTGESTDRYELFRHGGRVFNLSQSIMAGQLAILASSTGSLPIPLTVDGDTVGGEGTVLYQFLLPIDRGDVDKPTTQPAAAN